LTEANKPDIILIKMTKKQRNYYAMFMAVAQLCTKYSETIATVPALQSLFNEFRERQLQIDATMQVQQGRITGSAQQKYKEEQEMITATARMAAVLYVYALDTSNFEMAEKVNVNPSELTTMSQKVLQTTCLNILAELRKVDTQLANYGVTPGDTVFLEKEIGDYTSLMSKPRTEIVTRAEATSRLQLQFKDQLDLLNQKIDRMMMTCKASNPTFFNEYKCARVLVNMGVRHNNEVAETHA